MDDKQWIQLLEQGTYKLQKVIDCNQYTKKFGLQLSEQDAKELMAEQKQSLQAAERIEFGESILSRLIFAFCDSSYIYQDNYVDTMATLQRIFYLYKNESLDELSDDELISYMREAFEGECQGSLEHLEDTALEAFARKIRKQTHGFIGKYEEDDNGY